MSLDIAKQFENILKNIKNVLIFIPEDFSGDSVGSSFAMYLFLKKNNVEATIVIPDKNKIEKFSFLKMPESVLENLAGARDFVLSFNTKYNKITNVKTEKDENELRIFITPEKGSIDPRDFSFIPAKFKYDLVLSLGCTDKESIGKVYEENPDIFYEVPVINIDNNSDNDNFGQMNIIDIKASSVSEIVADLILKLDEKLIDEDIAKALLTGIIDKTNSFQQKNTTPKALNISATLMMKGADQQEIVRYLYKTQPLFLLKLWGRIMARLYWEEDIFLVWAPVYLEDFVQSRSNISDIPAILEKLKENYSAGKVFMVLYNETPEKIKVVIRCSSVEYLKTIADILEVSFKGEICEIFYPVGDILETGQSIVAKLKEKILN